MTHKYQIAIYWLINLLESMINAYILVVYNITLSIDFIDTYCTGLTVLRPQGTVASVGYASSSGAWDTLVSYRDHHNRSLKH